MDRRDTAALLVGTAIALTLCEGLLRFVVSLNRNTFDARAFTQFDPLLGWMNRPGGVTDYGSRINTRGLRDREHGPKNGRRILCLGDSFAWGAGVRGDEPYSKVLERETGVETINAGVCGWGTAQELLWLEREGFQYDPDVVTLGFYLNDFEDNLGDNMFGSKRNMFGSKRPFYTLEEGHLALKGVPISKPRAPIPLLTAQLMVAGWRWFDQGFLRAADASSIQRAKFHESTGTEPPPAEAVTKALLVEMKRVCEAKGVQFIVVVTPSLCLVRATSPVPCRKQGEVLYATLIRLCAEAGIKVVDPLAELRASEAVGVSGYPSDSGHWNAAGHRIVAHALARSLRDPG